jgi:hypothetical protein
MRKRYLLLGKVCLCSSWSSCPNAARGFNMTTKPAAQLSLEMILERNKAQAERLQQEAKDKLEENRRIEAEMQRILHHPPPSDVVGRLAHRNGDSMRLMAAENALTEPPPASTSPRMIAEREVLYAAMAITRSWKRRHKKNWKTQERELLNAVERLTGEK